MRLAAAIAILGVFSICSSPCGAARAQETPSAADAAKLDQARLIVNGDVEKPLSLSLKDLSALPRQILKVTNEHDKKVQTYQGVPLAELLKRAGVPQGGALQGPALAMFVRAEGADGYAVIFGLAELDSSVQDSGVLVADTLDGEPLTGNLGPLRLIVPHDKRPARWVRMLRSITVVKPSK